MHFKSLLITVVSLLALFITGCTTYHTDINKPLSEITSNQDKAYITFTRPSIVVGDGMNIPIIEFNPNTFEVNPVGILPSGKRLIYEVDEGTHYFYTTAGENDDMIKIDVSKHAMYYVSLAVRPGFLMSRTYFVPYKYSNQKFADSILNNKCTKEFLEKHDFVASSELTNGSSGEIFFSRKHHMTLTCYLEEIKNVEPHFSVPEMLGRSAIEPTQEAMEECSSNIEGYLKEIKEDFPGWISEDAVKTELKKEDGFPLN